MTLLQMMSPGFKYLNQFEAAPRKGGSKGSSTSTSRTVLDEDFKPVVDTALQDLKDAYDSGALGRVAGPSDLQTMVFDAAPDALDAGMEAMGAARGTYEEAMAGEGVFDPVAVDELESAAIDQAKRSMGLLNDNMAKSGLIGSSRATIAAGDQAAQLANALAEIKYNQLNRTQENAMWGADSMMNSGTGEANLLEQYAGLGDLQRSIEQEILDGDAKGLENYLTGIQAFTPIMTQNVQESQSTQKGGK